MLRIVVFDDHTLFGQSIVKLLKEYLGVDVFFSNTEKELLRYLNEYEIDILLLDINLKDKSAKDGLQLMKELLPSYQQLKVIILSSYDLPIYRKTAFEYGAKAFLNKSIEADKLIEKIKKVYKSQSEIYFEVPQEILTNREIEVIRELACGKKRETIAEELYISESTLYNHIKSIYGKLGVDNIVGACNRALELGYLKLRV